MARWEPNARERLARAALELFQERGFDETAVADIAERAGLTERTFFRHFADKREVLFGGSSELHELLMGGIAAAPATAGPMDAVAAALEASAAMFEERRSFAKVRQAVISAHPALRERELIKLASLAEAMAAALQERGVAEPAAALAAEAGMSVFKLAFARWTEDDQHELSRHLRDAMEQLRSLTAAGSRGPSGRGTRAAPRSRRKRPAARSR